MATQEAMDGSCDDADSRSWAMMVLKTEEKLLHEQSGAMSTYCK